MPQPKLNVLITGTSTGIGRLTAIAVAQAGHYVFASMRDRDGKNLHAAEELLGLARRDGLGIEVIDLDVTKPESVSTAIQACLHDPANYRQIERCQQISGRVIQKSLLPEFHLLAALNHQSHARLVRDRGRSGGRCVAMECQARNIRGLRFRRASERGNLADQLRA
jgi:NAD(P)-dependent dehydrogenase (short-subunit alcohol dehydrogenase family)